jgi:hypothetical protein
MTSPRKPWTEQDHDEATSKADDLGMKLYGLAQVVKLAAFAAEARRTLTDLEDRLIWRDKVREDLRNHVHQMTAWAEMPDTASDALQFIAGELAQANEEFTGLSYRLANRLRENEQAAGRAS